MNLSLFRAEAYNCGLCIPMITDLLSNEDVASFAEYLLIQEVLLDKVLKMARPSPVIFLTGKVYHGLVTTVYTMSNKYGYYCDPINALNYIHLAAKDRDVRYNLFIYFLTAVYQDLNQGMNNLKARE